MTQIRYERNSVGIEELLLGDQMGDVMEDYARAGLGVFEAIAPRESNRYAESGVVLAGTEAAPSPRRVAHLSVEVDYAVHVERRHHTLSRVADAIEGVS